MSFDTGPGRYRHLRLEIDAPLARIVLAVDEAGGLVPGYDLKLNSYDLGVDIELYDAVQRLRFEHPEVRAVVLTGGLDRVFCAGANIRMLAQSSHAWKVNFCKFTNETRNAIEDATLHSGQTYLAAVNGTAAGGGYELALACDRIILVDDGSTAVSLPEVPLLGVLPGTGGLTRLTDKRGVRKDLADVFATRSEGVRGATAVAWGGWWTRWRRPAGSRRPYAAAPWRPPPDPPARPTPPRCRCRRSTPTGTRTGRSRRSRKGTG
ncbi:enoyl-CoA hydratase-related protein [Nonomuraea salmonea]|uniref:enoyl-CoA hydratase-related protein n=1 Tax=Nonomuraea salmonea TaxID=46181 RepID=UPI002FEC992A